MDSWNHNLSSKGYRATMWQYINPKGHAVAPNSKICAQLNCDSLDRLT